MKILGIVLINIAFTALGLFKYFSVKEKVQLCNELILMARAIKSSLCFSSGKYDEVLDALRKDNSLKNLRFLNEINAEAPRVKTSLPDAENVRIERIFKMLGSVDVQSMTDELNAYEAYAASMKDGYSEKLKTHSRLYILSGILSGAAVSIMLL